MPLSLKEAEAAAYTDPSQENLAVYVKLLEEALEDAGETRGPLAKFQEAYDAAQGDREVAEAAFRFLEEVRA